MGLSFVKKEEEKGCCIYSKFDISVDISLVCRILNHVFLSCPQVYNSFSIYTLIPTLKGNLN